jgi:TetR/AcrR family transcriptional regulator, regulator of biofilm formation and stress response
LYKKKSKQDKKKAIINSVIQIIGGKGVSAVTHRAVAKRAGVSLAATTYYFKSRDEMIESAFVALIKDGIKTFSKFIEELKSSKTDKGAVFAKYLDEVIGEKSGNRINYIATLELVLESSRNNKYRSIINKYSKVHINLLKMLLKKEYQDPYSIFVVQSLIQGIVSKQLVTPEKKFKTDMLMKITKQYFKFCDS